MSGNVFRRWPVAAAVLLAGCATAPPAVTESVSASARRGSGSSSPQGKLFDASFDAGWEPDVFGANTHAAQAAFASEDASEAALANARVSLAAEVAVTYAQLRGAQRAAIGVVFGYFPARRAARLDPIEALRHE